MYRHAWAHAALAAALAFPSDASAATDAELADIRDQIRQLKESYETRINALEARLREAEARAANAPAPAAAVPAAAPPAARNATGRRMIACAKRAHSPSRRRGSLIGRARATPRRSALTRQPAMVAASPGGTPWAWSNERAKASAATALA